MVGVGYRKEFVEDFESKDLIHPKFIEVAPENWIGVGGYFKKKFDKALERYPLYTHGLSLSVGSPEGVDVEYLKTLKTFLDETNAQVFSEHLSFSKCDNAHLYDLLPIPFTEEAIKHVSENIKLAQDVLERKIAIEIASYYSPIAPEMTEVEFVNRILEESDCNLLLDINNIYVNSFNHHYNAKSFLNALNTDKATYIHMAGHTQVADDLIIDTHGEDIIDPVYDLFEYTMGLLKRDIPVLLERDFNIPELPQLQLEMDKIEAIKRKSLTLLTYE